MAGPQVAQAMPLQANPHERNEQSADRASNEPGDSVSAPQGVVRSQPTPDLFRDMDSSSLTGRIPDMFQAGLTPGQPSDPHGSPPYREYAPDSSCQPGGATSPGQPSQDQLNPMALLMNLQSQLNMMQQRLAESERERDNVAEALGELMSTRFENQHNGPNHVSSANNSNHHYASQFSATVPQFFTPGAAQPPERRTSHHPGVEAHPAAAGARPMAPPPPSRVRFEQSEEGSQTCTGGGELSYRSGAVPSRGGHPRAPPV